MKRQLTAAIGASVIGLSMAVLPVPASAQTNTGDTGTTGTTTGGTTTTDTTNTNYRGDDGFDWGWLGLLGLLGLGGLAGKRREEATRYRDPNAVGTTGYRE
ncbi:WGxxGxxG family protein [Scytonema sp. PCC 10023]|uniref:WGxxGxxG family protein n=1 Tax=Scytonema sp. PCC 10023 TaxID=1680591 RepID=UPI0039C72C09